LETATSPGQGCLLCQFQLGCILYRGTEEENGADRVRRVQQHCHALRIQLLQTDGHPYGEGGDAAYLCREFRLLKVSVDGVEYDVEYVNRHGVVEDELVAFPDGETGGTRFGSNAKKYAGKDMPLPDELASKYGNSIPFTEEGFADFETVMVDNDIEHIKLERFPMSGDSAADIREANRMLHDRTAYPPQWSDYIWHHNHDGSMILVPKDLHEFVKHYGGDALTRARLGG
jgi:A nuclease of the HNH/ENDO VII superfamily with conserved WHH